MIFRQLSIEEFTNFQKNHPLSNFYQTINYAMFKAEDGFDYELVGLLDENEEVNAASLILLKPIGIKCYYGYAPRGFLIDYQNNYLVKKFTEELKKYFYQKNVIFIKLNPLIISSEIDNKNFTKTYHNTPLNTLTSLNYKKLKDNLYFEAMLPRFNAFIDLQNLKLNNFSKNTKNKIKKGIRKGLVFEKVEKDNLCYLADILKDNLKNEYFLQDYYTVFAKDNSIDLFLVSIDYNALLKNSQYIYEEENIKNTKLNNKLTKNSSERIINAKMNSDRNLLSYKNDIMEATKGMTENNKTYIAGALVIKHNKTVSIIYSGFLNSYKRFAPNYFLHYNIAKYYKNDYDYLDLNGIVGDFQKENPYTGLNRFKLGFNPLIYEYLGEFDLVIEEKSYNILLNNGILAKEFNKRSS